MFFSQWRHDGPDKEVRGIVSKDDILLELRGKVVRPEMDECEAEHERDMTIRVRTGNSRPIIASKASSSMNFADMRKHSRGIVYIRSLCPRLMVRPPCSVFDFRFFTEAIRYHKFLESMSKPLPSNLVG